MHLKLLFSFSFLLLLLQLKAQTIIHVDASASGTNTGASWTNAYTDFQDAIDVAVTGDEIWLKRGVYLPSKDKTGNNAPSNNRNKTFFFNKDIKVYGGFVGTETALNQRNCSAASTTMLSGDLGVVNTYSDNTYHIVYTENVSSNFLMDCITISGGYSEIVQLEGAGWYNDGSGTGNNSNPTLQQIRFERNAAALGGAMFNNGSGGGNASPNYDNCTFWGNLGEYGGAVNNHGENNGNASPTFTNCLFDSNIAGTGGAVFNGGEFGNASPSFTDCNFDSNHSTAQAGAVYNHGALGISIPSFTDCDFSHNHTNGDGGAVYNFGVGGAADATYTNVSFTHNRASRNGGAINNFGASPIINNCQFIADTAYSHGGAIYNGGNQGGISSPIVTNAIFEGNRANFWGGAVFNDGLAGLSSPVFANCKFVENIAVRGGAIVNDGRIGISSPSYTNCIFSQNEATDQGGAVNNLGGNGQCSPTFINCSFSTNSAIAGGAMISDGTNGSCLAQITNCILWDNGSSVVITAATLTASYSDIESQAFANGVVDGGNNITANPMFTNPTSNDLTLQSSSPCINTGDNSANSLPTDLAGNMRIQGSTIDMGAYEGDPCPKRLYVDLNAVGANTGSSWADAFVDLQSALQFTGVCPIDTIWVAEGTYFTTSTTTRTIAFDLPSGIKVFGGFPRPSTWPGNNPVMIDRDWDTYQSILSGDIGVTGDATDNTYNIVTANQVSPGTLINGFYIQDGNANTSSSNYSSGGGLRHRSNGPNTTSDLEVYNCRFINNFARSGGGGVYNNGNSGGTATITINNSTFDGNRVTDLGGGAIYNHGYINSAASLTVNSCLFENNQATSNSQGGGAIRNWSFSSSSFTSQVIQCVFRNNTGTGGGAYTDLADPSGSTGISNFEDCLFENNTCTNFSTGALDIGGNMTTNINRCKFISNTARHAGGAISIFHNTNNSTVNVTNSLFYDNRTNSTGSGGAFYISGGNSSVIDLTLTNCTIAQNFASSGGVIYTSFPSNAPISTVNIDIVNTAISGNTASTFSQFRTVTGTTINIEHSSLQGNSCIANNGGSGVINCNAGMLYGQDPLFVNQAVGNLHLLPTSPVLDVGTANNAPVDDLDARVRPYGTGYDMGCYEFNGSVVGVSTIEEEPVFSIHPNPASHEIRLLCPATLEGHLDLQLFDLQGRMLFSETVNTAEPRLTLPNELQPGMYLLKILHRNEQISKVLKLVKH